MKDENLNTCSKSKQMLLNMLVVISTSLNCSDSTVKLQGDGECEPTIKESTSERMVVVDSEGNAVSNDERHANKRRKTSSQQSTTSKNQTSAQPFDIKVADTQNQAVHLVPKLTELNLAEQIEVKHSYPEEAEKGKNNTEILGTKKSSSLSYYLLAPNLENVTDDKELHVYSKEECKHQSSLLSLDLKQYLFPKINQVRIWLYINEGQGQTNIQ